ncbi:MFS transporter [Streptomyces sp. NEAU-Y11]|uniref:MFS transporter n=1 Tax=Streptomyces cucumeris TaxID=2962890 RepID=UPI0020C8B3F3|nr:MFS transporter [Streptomyces sp. NEAU-Y11]MCP9206677.1 MFS transporter [Streptomyces sp. NEAU-Y11]
MATMTRQPSHTPRAARPATPRRGADATTTRQGPALVALATAQFLVVLSTSIVNVALPSISAGLGLSPTALSWVVNAYVLAFGALLLVGGRLADLVGSRRMFTAGMTVFALASLVAGLTSSAPLLIAARAVQGVGAALLAPAALSLLLGTFPPGPGRGRALGIWGAVSGAGGAVGVLLSGLLTELYGWPAVFLVQVPIAALSLVATLIVVPPGRATGGAVDILGALISTVSLTAVVYALTTRNVLAGAAGLLLLAVFARQQTRARTPLVPPRLLRTGKVAAANLTMTLLGAVFVGLFSFLPLYQQRVLHYSPLAAGLTQLPLALAVVTGSMAAPRLPVRASTAGALTVLTGGLVWLSLGPDHGPFTIPSFTGQLLGPSLLIGAGLGIAFVRLTALSTDGVPAADSGLAGGLVNTTRQLGGALGLALMTAVAPAATDFGTAFLTAALVAAFAALTALFALTGKKQS